MQEKNLTGYPLNDRLIIKPIPVEKTKGGIIIPDTAQEKPLKGQVLAVGPECPQDRAGVKTGDIVLYGKYAGSEVELDGEDLLIMRFSDLLYKF